MKNSKGVNNNNNDNNCYLNWFYEILDCEKWSKHRPELIREAKGDTILWDFAVQT